MSLSQSQVQSIESELKQNIRHKFSNYNPEPAAMPFHTRLLGNDRLALYQFIHSLNTNFGTKIFEPVAKIISEDNFELVETGVKAGNMISQSAQNLIQQIVNELSIGRSMPDKETEIEKIRAVAQEGGFVEIKPTRVDLKLEENGCIYLSDLKTAKPNAGGFKEFKRTLLEWVGVTLAINPNAKVNTFIAIPYNPYEPNPYQRWTMRGMLDLENDLKVAEEFWDFLGGEGTYKELLNCFERVGIELRGEIDAYFSKFK